MEARSKTAPCLLCLNVSADSPHSTFILQKELNVVINDEIGKYYRRSFIALTIQATFRCAAGVKRNSSTLPISQHLSSKHTSLGKAADGF